MNLSRRIVVELERSKSPDPRVVARRVMARMSPEERDAALADALVGRVRVQITQMRSALTAKARRRGMSRWEVARQREAVDAVWKFSDDLTALDLRVMAEAYERRAGEMQAKASECVMVAGRLEAAGVSTVGELRAQNSLAVAA